MGEVGEERGKDESDACGLVEVRVQDRDVGEREHGVEHAEPAPRVDERYPVDEEPGFGRALRVVSREQEGAEGHGELEKRHGFEEVERGDVERTVRDVGPPA